MIVADASAAVSALLNTGSAREQLAQNPIAIPHLADSEVANTLRRMVLNGEISGDHGKSALAVWSKLGMRRYPAAGLLDRIWQLKENVSAYDATYVALAEALDCPLLSADRRLATSPTIRCQVLVVEPGQV